MLYANCLEGLVQAVSVIEGSLEALLNGTISVGNFNLIMERDEKFPELVELISKKHSKKFIKNVLQVRQKEMKEFQLQAEKMAHLASLCQHLKNGKLVSLVSFLLGKFVINICISHYAHEVQISRKKSALQ